MEDTLFCPRAYFRGRLWLMDGLILWWRSDNLWPCDISREERDDSREEKKTKKSKIFWSPLQEFVYTENPGSVKRKNSNSPSTMLHTQTRCRPVHVRGVSAGQKTVKNQDWAAGRPAVAGLGPPGGWAVAGRGSLGRGPGISKTQG